MREVDQGIANERGKGIGWIQIVAIVLVAMVITAAATLWLVKTYFFTPEFTPVTLSQEEERVLSHKLERLETPAPAPGKSSPDLVPEKYSESGLSREVRLSERELNGLLANNTDLARRVAIDLSENLISAKILIPMDEDFPVMGGKTLRAKTGVTFAYDNDRPVVKLRGVTIMGVPLPNAWLGGLKNIDLVSEFGHDDGFWKAFADGVEAVSVEEGNLMIRLRE